MQGQMKLGPSAYYVNKIDYDVAEKNKKIFLKSVKKFLPFVEEKDLSADMAGIRPKLQAPGEDARDFIIAEEADKGFRGFIDLIGIESPGLTASLSIAKYVGNMV
jgi:L-2-hydroxyglutarate oxidase LhgO